MSQEQALDLLCRCLAEHRPDLADPRRFKALLRDSFKGQCKRELNLLLMAQEKGIPAELQAQSLPALGLARASSRLTHEFGIEASLARWTVEAWALALGLIPALTPVKPADLPPHIPLSFPRPIPLFIQQGPKRPAARPEHPMAMRPQIRKRPPGSS